MTSHSILSPVRHTAPKRGVKAMAAALGLALSLSVSPLAFAQQPPVQPGAGAQQLPSFSPLVKKVLPAVVSIQVTEKAAAGNGPAMGPGGLHGGPFDEMLRRFFEQQQGQNNQDQNDDDDLVRVAHDVVVGHDIARGIDDEARAQGHAFRALAAALATAAR